MQKTAISSFGPGQTVTLKNLTDFPAYYFGAVTADELIQPSSLMIPPHSEITVTTEQLGSPNNKFLIIGNKETLETSLLVVQIIVK